MFEWLAVFVAASCAGFLGTFLPAGLDTPFPPLFQRLLDDRPAREVVAHCFRNTLFGGLAGFFIWVGVNESASFGGTDVAPQAVATAMLVGLGGTAALNTIMRSKGREDALETALRGVLGSPSNGQS